MNDPFHNILRQFDIPPTVDEVEPLGSGLIHQTFLAGRASPRFVLQKFNHRVFRDPAAVMNNIATVTGHIQKKLDPDGTMQCIRIVKTRSNKMIYRDPEGNFWRMYPFIGHSETFDQVPSAEHAREAARAFGHFCHMLSDLNPDRLVETIPHFHHVGIRFQQLEKAAEEASPEIRRACSTEIELALARRPRVKQWSLLFESPKVPRRVTHNDTKINNILFHSGTTDVLAVIDLDTVMPGLLLFDFGDIVRTFCAPSEEDLNAVSSLDTEVFFEVCRGFMSGVGNTLSRGEASSLWQGPWLLTFIMGIRFLTDYLQGNIYYRTLYPEQNLDRARNQLTLIQDIERKEPTLREIISSCSGEDHR